MGPDLSNSLRELFETGVTLALKDINSIPTDNANRAFQGNVTMKVTQPDVQLWKYKNISNKILLSERADLVDMCPDFDFFMMWLNVFIRDAFRKNGIKWEYFPN